MKTLSAALLLCLPMIAQAADSPLAASTEKEKKVCRSEESTGSLFVKRVCHTKTEWAALDIEGQRSAEHIQNQSRGNGVDIPR
ncbi:hypothetical protein [Sphingomonas sp. PAMC 26605]|uniref:hypothetical protein n=1 Tax=Sphingomonas sp. PAMC 26605 TaxID=1112214 RepID=UPI00026CA208|nr:hypothetical protein [Sphingomonas sp. PAMC 26605]